MEFIYSVFKYFTCCVAITISSSDALKFENNGYQDLLVTISPDVEEGANPERIIDKLKVVQFPYFILVLVCNLILLSLLIYNRAQ